MHIYIYIYLGAVYNANFVLVSPFNVCHYSCINCKPEVRNLQISSDRVTLNKCIKRC